jgi:glucokinase
MKATAPVGAIEVGGSHVTAAPVDAAAHAVWPGRSRERCRLEPGAERDALLGAIIGAARAAGVGEAARCGVAVPGPFDYPAGVAHYTGVGKFESLAGVDVGAVLHDALPGPRFAFVNDAAAFLLGEAAAGAALGHARAMAITLGTGVGSAFLADGVIVADGAGLPPGGEVHHIRVDGRPLEDVVSTRAIVDAYRRTAGDAAGGGDDVRTIAERARTGDAAAAAALGTALGQLGAVLAPLAAGFGATVLVVGGSMAGSWDLVRPVLAACLGELAIERSADPEWSALLGAALAAEAYR